MDKISRTFEKADYLDMIKWYAAWNVEVPPYEMLPKNGFVVPMVCAGFLCLTDTPLGIIDFYITNPGLSKELRDTCLNAITEDLIECAKTAGCRALMATSNISAVKKRAEAFGFKYRTDVSVYMREI